jgi:LPXTG-motif cell wall-anchored protein
MRRLCLCLSLCLFLCTAPAAFAKGVSQATACGASGCRDATPRHPNDTALLEGGPEIAIPAHRAPYFELRVVIGAPDNPEARAQILYVPSLHAIRVHWPNQLATWMHATGNAEQALKRATAGLTPIAASKLALTDGSETYDVPKPRVVEVVPAPQPDAGGSGWPAWAAGALGGLLLAGGAWLLVRRRRAGPDPHPIG